MESNSFRRRIELTQVIAKAIRDQGIKKNHLAELIGAYPSQITRMLDIGHNFTIDTLFRIDEALKLKLFRSDFTAPDAPTEVRKYTYKDKEYEHMYFSQMKIGEAWLPCVIYKSKEDDKIYVRELGDFHEKFVRM